MRSRMTRLGAALAALAALAVGGSAFASAAHKTAPATKPAAKHVKAAKATPAAKPAKATAAKAGASDPADEGQGTDTDTVQQGDQSAPDTGGTADEQSGESPESGPSDGPGGHADPAGAVDTQQEGQN
jgi:hypothetical protein